MDVDSRRSTARIRGRQVPWYSAGRGCRFCSEARVDTDVEAERILDHVCRILEASSRRLVAAELVTALAEKGIEISKQALNNILYEPRNARPGLVHDERWRWSYSAPIETESTGEDTEVQHQVTVLLSACKDVGLTFEGIRRKNGEALFLLLGETETGYRVVGPSGRILHEDSRSFRDPEECNLAAF